MFKRAIQSLIIISFLPLSACYMTGGIGYCHDYAVNPPPACPECGFLGSISYLYLKPYQDNNEWASFSTPLNQEISNLDNDIETNKAITDRKSVGYKWDSGFDVELGYMLPCDQWTIRLSWDHYETDASGKASGNPAFIEPSFVLGIPVEDIGGATSIIAEGSAKWRLRFNQLDLTASREYLVGKWMTVTPFLGLRALWIYQKYLIRTHNEVEVPLGVRIFDTESKLLTDFKSFGLVGGLDSFYEICSGIGVYGNLGVSIVYGHYDNSHQFSISEFILQQNRGSNLLLNNRNVLRGSFDLGIGLKWRSPINCNRGEMYASIGWDHRLYMDQNAFLTLLQVNFSRPHIQYDNGNLYLYGLRFEIGAAF